MNSQNASVPANTPPAEASVRPARFHTATLLLLSVLTGVLLGLNIYMRVTLETGRRAEKNGSFCFAKATYYWGWPLALNVVHRETRQTLTTVYAPAYLHSLMDKKSLLTAVARADTKAMEDLLERPGAFSGQWLVFGVVLNLAVLAFIILLTGAGLEALLRRLLKAKRNVKSIDSHNKPMREP